MSNSFAKWRTRRHTGMRVSWEYSVPVQPEQGAREDNQVLTKLVNLLHATEPQHHQQISALVRSARRHFLSRVQDYSQLSCLKGKYSAQLEAQVSDMLGNISNVSSQGIDGVLEELSNETLQLAAETYIYLVHCPDRYSTVAYLPSFYSPVIQQASLRTLLLTLARMISTTRKSSKSSSKQEMRTATLLLGKLAEKTGLRYQDLDLLTSSLARIRGNKDLEEKYELLRNCSDSPACRWWAELDTEVVRQIYHPLHINSDQGRSGPLSYCHKDTAQGTQSPLLGAFLAFRCVFMAKGNL